MFEILNTHRIGLTANKIFQKKRLVNLKTSQLKLSKMKYGEKKRILNTNRASVRCGTTSNSHVIGLGILTVKGRQHEQD